MRFLATPASQRRVATVLKLVSPEGILILPESIIGCSTFMAPLKKKVALLSSGEPANSSTFHGAALPLASRPLTSDSACSSPTLRLSNVV